MEQQQSHQLDLFNLPVEDDELSVVAIAPQISEAEKYVLEQLKQLSPDELNAREALELVYKLHEALSFRA